MIEFLYQFVRLHPEQVSRKAVELFESEIHSFSVSRKIKFLVFFKELVN